MTEPTPPQKPLPAQPTKSEEKQLKLAAALRDNLKKRKKQESARAKKTKPLTGHTHK
jgi:hypothetical protein